MQSFNSTEGPKNDTVYLSLCCLFQRTTLLVHFPRQVPVVRTLHIAEFYVNPTLYNMKAMEHIYIAKFFSLTRISLAEYFQKINTLISFSTWKQSTKLYGSELALKQEIVILIA